MREARLLGAAATLAALLPTSPSSATPPSPASMARVGPATYYPFYPPSEKERAVPVAAFLLDRVPVTNADYLAFVKTHPRWERGAVSRLFADEQYLAQWRGPADLGAADPRQPVVHVSWFAAKAFCAARSARLPRDAEWEVAAYASATKADARLDPDFRETILAWYARPSAGSLARVGGAPNFWGVSNLHGLVWEWTLDFNSSLVSSDARESGDQEKMRFCGSGALRATDTTNYPSFMRVAFRSSLRADFTTKNLGFRCASDAPLSK